MRNKALLLIDAAERVTGMNRALITSRLRGKKVMDARIAIALAAYEFGVSQSRIARALNRHPSTINYMVSGKKRTHGVTDLNARKKRLAGVVAQIVAVARDPVNGGKRGKIVFQERVV